MISKEAVLGLIEPVLEEKNFFVVMLEISTSNKIVLHIDSMSGVTIDEIVKISRLIEHGLDREEEDFELEVSSAGLDAPFTRKEQYLKNAGREVSVLLPDGRKETGTLSEAGDEGFKIEQRKRVRVEGKKKKQLQIQELDFSYQEVSKVKLELKYK